ncbi:MAG: hypothetical protein M1812_000588 [Candelaria pacifica]|nr:MAG: hypothetical protein M1812_000588 [Candelaria pacifica]
MHISDFALSLIIVASSVLGAPPSILNSRGGDVGIILWKDGGYNGDTVKVVSVDGQCGKLLPRDFILNPPTLNNAHQTADLGKGFKSDVSSLAPIDGSDCKIYAGKGCTGKELDVTKAIDHLTTVKFNNIMSSFNCKHHFVPGPPPLNPPHHDAVDLGCAQQNLAGGPGGSQQVPWAQIMINGKICTTLFDDSAGVCAGGRDKWGPLKKCGGATFTLDTSGGKSRWTVTWPDGMVQSCDRNTKVSLFSSICACSEGIGSRLLCGGGGTGNV